MKYLALPFAVMLVLFMAACGDDDDDETTDTGQADTGVADTGVADTGGADMAGPTMVSVTFVADTNTTADGTNALAPVAAGETVYVVGSAPQASGGDALGNWGEAQDFDPRLPANAMTANGDGTFEITIDIEAGTSMEYKFTMSDGTGDNGWANGMKDYEDTDAGMTCGGSGDQDCSCPAANDNADFLAAHSYTDNTDMPGGLWEVPNIAYTVPDDGTTEVTLDAVEIEAWRDYAETNFGYYGGCN
jgi:hypothetical protein